MFEDFLSSLFLASLVAHPLTCIFGIDKGRPQMTSSSSFGRTYQLDRILHYMFL